MFNHYLLYYISFNRFVVSGVYNIVKKNELGYENICARSCFRKYTVLLVVTDYWFVFLQLIMINFIEKNGMGFWG